MPIGRGEVSRNGRAPSFIVLSSCSSWSHESARAGEPYLSSVDTSACSRATTTASRQEYWKAVLPTYESTSSVGVGKGRRGTFVLPSWT